MEQITTPLFVNNGDAVESTQGPGLATSANVQISSSYGNVVFTEFCSATCFKQHLVDYQKLEKSCWIIGSKTR